MTDQTIFIIMCKSRGQEFAWEAHLDTGGGSGSVRAREMELARRNPNAEFRTLKTKLVK